MGSFRPGGYYRAGGRGFQAKMGNVKLFVAKKSTSP